MGINYNAERGTFEFDFEHDGREDIISLTGSGYKVEASTMVMSSRTVSKARFAQHSSNM